MDLEKLTDEDYLDFDPFEGDRDVDVRNKVVRIVTTRMPHQCMDPNTGKLHEIPPKTRARHEKAIVDGDWCSYYTCLSCITKWLHDCQPLEGEG